MDSISLAVVTPSGTVFSKSYGALKANETTPEKRGRPDENSLYRIASISKMFTVFELLVLREKGLVGWDDSVSKYLKNFTYKQHGWGAYISEGQPQASGHVSSRDPNANKNEPITFRQLASHMAGIGLDYPPIDVESWPKGVPDDVLWLHHASNATQAETLQTIRDLPLVAPPYTLPAYTNAGFNVFGWALAVAAGGGTGDYVDALQRDIFDPLGLSMDYDVGSYNPSAGQFSSLRDLITVMPTFLDPTRNNSLLSPYSMREWLRPLHGFADDFSEMGAPWEIIKMSDSKGNTKRWYNKSGNFLASHSNFIFDPVSSFGVFVLMTGQSRNALGLAIQATQIFRPAFDWLQEEMSRNYYGGFWQSDDMKSHAIAYVDKGSMWLGGLVLNETDVFEMLEGRPSYPKTRKYGLWPTGRDEEFRVALGGAKAENVAFLGCLPSFSSMDPFFARGAPIDLVLFEGDVEERLMKIPSPGVVLRRAFKDGKPSFST